MGQCEWGIGKDYAKVGEIPDNEYLIHIPPTKLHPESLGGVVAALERGNNEGILLRLTGKGLFIISDMLEGKTTEVEVAQQTVPARDVPLKVIGWGQCAYWEAKIS